MELRQNTPLHKLREVERQINDAILFLVHNRVITNETLETVRQAAEQFLRSRLSSSEYSQVQIVASQSTFDPRVISLIPSNLFTFLIMYGKYVPLFVLKGKDEYTDVDGNYRIHDGQAEFRSNLPLNYIEINITIPKENI